MKQTPEEKQRKLNENWAQYQKEALRMAKEGKSIGTFSSWQFANGLVDIKIANSREEHFKL